MSWSKGVRNQVRELERLIHVTGGQYEEWYAGITSDYKSRLFDDHNVHHGMWACHEYPSDRVARDVEAYFHAKGCQGAGGGGNPDSKYFYLYMITPYTVE